MRLMGEHSVSLSILTEKTGFSLEEGNKVYCTLLLLWTPLKPPELCLFFPLLFGAGDAGRRLWRGENVSTGALQRRSVPGRQLHLHRGHRLQGECESVVWKAKRAKSHQYHSHFTQGKVWEKKKKKTSFHQDLKDACHVHSQIFTFNHRPVRFRAPPHLLSGVQTWNLLLAVGQQLVSVLAWLKLFVCLSL